MIFSSHAAFNNQNKTNSEADNTLNASTPTDSVYGAENRHA